MDEGVRGHCSERRLRRGRCVLRFVGRKERMYQRHAASCYRDADDRSLFWRGSAIESDRQIRVSMTPGIPK
jgi:hypothetical protein